MDIPKILVACLLAAALLPVAVETLIGVNTTTWSTGAVAIWDALPIIILVGVLLGFLAFSRVGAGRKGAV